MDAFPAPTVTSWGPEAGGAINLLLTRTTTDVIIDHKTTRPSPIHRVWVEVMVKEQSSQRCAVHSIPGARRGGMASQLPPSHPTPALKTGLVCCLWAHAVGPPPRLAMTQKMKGKEGKGPEAPCKLCSALQQNPAGRVTVGRDGCRVVSSGIWNESAADSLITV